MVSIPACTALVTLEIRDIYVLTYYIERGCLTFFPKSTFVKNTQDTPKPFPLPLLLYNLLENPGQLCMSRKK